MTLLNNYLTKLQEQEDDEYNRYYTLLYRTIQGAEGQYFMRNCKRPNQSSPPADVKIFNICQLKAREYGLVKGLEYLRGHKPRKDYIRERVPRLILRNTKRLQQIRNELRKV